jgi:integrase
MKNKRVKFTKKELDGLAAADAGKRRYVYDSEVRGLALSITDKGVKTFILYRRVMGKPERMFLGRYPDLSIEQARGKAAENAGAIAKGENPADKRRLDRTQMTLQDLFDEYLKRHSKPRKRTWKEDESKFKQYFTNNDDGINLAIRKLSTIRRNDMAQLHAKIGTTHPVTANRIMILASSIFGRAIEWGLWEAENPCKGIRRYKEVSRDRYLHGDELPKFFQALANEPNETMRDFFLMALLTGGRRANVQSMRWEDLVLTEDRNEWRIPKTKSGDHHTVPLTPEAVAILKRRREAAKDDDAYVFSGTGKHGHLMEPKKAWKRILTAAGLSDVRIHDLRRTMGSWQAATGASLAIIGKTLHHANVSTTAIYARLNLDPVRAAMETATSAMFVAGGIKPPAKVKRMRKAAGHDR